ncbi:hypothetical protein KC19_7G038600 [Ceratodon purpureus]|uniref:Uncharacterized protein n=1 Tax=Ceratodon purpureus TaxID=3225 RepID=A0A8T0H495_CERPU|nr:hypothetical protein KC19_7G038600 [Ceratodon purpureus]
MMTTMVFSMHSWLLYHVSFVEFKAIVLNAKVKRSFTLFPASLCNWLDGSSLCCGMIPIDLFTHFTLWAAHPL